MTFFLGPQPAVPMLDPVATIHRFNSVFVSFIYSIACKEHPLVIFLDDLQCKFLSSLSLLPSPHISSPNLCPFPSLLIALFYSLSFSFFSLIFSSGWLKHAKLAIEPSYVHRGPTRTLSPAGRSIQGQRSRSQSPSLSYSPGDTAKRRASGRSFCVSSAWRRSGAIIRRYFQYKAKYVTYMGSLPFSFLFFLSSPN